ncbi:outer membrane beta-barrel protein [Hyphomicrobium sp.]|jgi:opacity protein-like surface antigen|uniref:outer membrane protein n=1 Tax=Hyphomicrobium sp. TaxID=82 RepID=UPI002CEAAE79|nr:outer membrane beta-barrel protein [Hyphomicrobium sp.]HVZ04660.1 outer membrane beta-barrel protein [Hyphomicrobium sp.]
MFNVQKVLLLGAALVLGSALNASAADLGGNLNEAPQMAPMPAPSAGWYARVDGGYTLFTDPTIDAGGTITRTTNTGIDNAWSVGGGIGRYFGRGFRGDITVDHLFDATTEGSMYCECGTFLGDAKFDFSSTVLLANLYYDFNRGGRFVPYIGAGIGWAHNETSSGTVDVACGCEGSIAKGSSNNFAAAAMAGFSWRIRGGGTTYVGGMKDEPVAINNGHALYLDVGYRFLYLGDAQTGDMTFDYPSEITQPRVNNITAHQIRVGLRYDLN